jgi:tetratricopeptide (TPR) repeat protein
MNKKTVGLIALIATIIFCGCPGLVGIMSSFGSIRDNPVSSLFGIGLNLIQVAIPVGIYFLVFRSKMAQTESSQTTQLKLIQDLRYQSPEVARIKAEIDRFEQQNPALGMLGAMSGKYTLVGENPPPALQTLLNLKEKLTKAKEIEKNTRANAALKLGEFPNQSAVDSLIVALNDDYPIVRSNATESLGKVGDRKAITYLSDLSKNDPDENVCKRAQEAIDKINLYQPLEAKIYLTSSQQEAATEHFNLAMQYRENGNLEQAIKEYGDSISINPQYIEARFNLGEVLALKGDIEKAKKIYESTLFINPNYAPAHYCLGVYWTQKGRTTEAIQEFQTSISMQPDLVESHYNLGVIYSGQGQKDKAITEYKEELRINPSHARAHYNIGVIYMKQNQFSEAIEEYKAALQIDPDYANAHYYLGTILGKLGRAEEALPHVEAALKSQQGEFDRKIAQGVLNELKTMIANKK